MLQQYVLDLHPSLSAIRLERYRPQHGSDLEMLTNYFWNMALSESLYPALHAVELALRNTIHTTLTARYLTQTWWHQTGVLLPRQHTMILDIENDYLQKHRTNITPGRLIAELNFGFWTTLLSHPYESRIWRQRQFYLLHQAFPHAGRFKRDEIHKRFNHIRIYLRNRVMHYEAIYDRPNLLQEHAEIHNAIRWISPELHQGIHAVDSFNEIYDGRQRVYNKLHNRLGGP
ncbi:MAG: hypothetical protein IT336_15805 [Thermomicrobiales bacterium]|nr:hypothetical protein [Thermomicrobiales bacterium]